MAKIATKINTLEQAKALCAAGKFPYYHPCAGCGKACSAPTKPFWQKRVKEYGSIDGVYAKYTCRDCRKVNKVEKKTKYVTTTSSDGTKTEYVRPVRKPGEFIKLPEGSMGVSEWVEGKFIGTTFYKI